MPYCIDTSSVVAAWDERYPIGHFQNFWDLLEVALKSGDVVTPVVVVDELNKKSVDLSEWLKQVKAGVLQIDEPIQREVSAVLQKHPRLVAEKKQRFAADTFVIAAAKLKSFTVITEESPVGLTRPNIPDVCNDFDVPSINLIKFIRLKIGA